MGHHFIASKTPTGPNRVQNGKVPNGKVLNGKIPNGKVPNGKVPNGKVPNGKIPKGPSRGTFQVNSQSTKLSTNLSTNTSSTKHQTQSPPKSQAQLSNQQKQTRSISEEQWRKTVLDKLYVMVHEIEPILCCKITGMLCHNQPTKRLEQLLAAHQRELLEDKITEAKALLTGSSSNGGIYYELYHGISGRSTTEAQIEFLRDKLYDQVLDYTETQFLTDIITEMLLQLDISELFVLLNEPETRKKRMDQAINQYIATQRQNTMLFATVNAAQQQIQQNLCSPQTTVCAMPTIQSKVQSVTPVPSAQPIAAHTIPHTIPYQVQLPNLSTPLVRQQTI